MTRIRTLVGATALVLLLAAPASAGVEVGAEAPDFSAGGCLNSEPITLAELKGRLVLLELFSTT
jgi:hypothetical protein